MKTDLKQKRAQYLAWFTLGFTYILMVWGNMVSATGSGLACPDWPLCHGTIAPPVRFDVILEWGHRLLAFTTTCLILTTFFFTWRISSDSKYSALRRTLFSILGLLAIQIPLGGLTVYLGLSIAASTVHLSIAMFVFAGIIALASVLTWESKNLLTQNSNPILGSLALITLIALFVQIALGGLVRHGHAGLACPLFPLCQTGAFWPTPFIFETALAFIHRWWGVMLIPLFAAIHFQNKKTGAHDSFKRVTLIVFFLALTQVLLGISTVLTGVSTLTRGAHAALGYALWALTFYICIRSGKFRWIYQKSRHYKRYPSVDASEGSPA